MNWRKIKWKSKVFTIKYLYYIVYFNYKYRIRGYYQTVKDYADQFKSDEQVYFEVYPETISEIDIPDQMLKDSSPYVKYQLKAIDKAKYILKVKNGRVLTDTLWTLAILDGKDKLIGEATLDLYLNSYQNIQNSKILRRKCFPRVKYLKGTVFSTVGGGGSYINYGHWLVDSFSKLHILKKSGLFDEVDWFYVPSTKYDYQLDSLLQLGIPEEKIINSDEFPHIKADVVLASSYTRGNHQHIPQWVIDFYVKEFPPKNKPEFASTRIYISRKDSSVRNIVNEEEVSSLLAGYQFENIVLSKLSFQQKIDLFAHAETIISLSGAGLTNMMFCKEGTVILELFGDQFVDFTFYYDIATKKKLKHFYLTGKNVGKVKSVVAGQRNDVIVDIKRLKDMVENKLLLSSK